MSYTKEQMDMITSARHNIHSTNITNIMAFTDFLENEYKILSIDGIEITEIIPTLHTVAYYNNLFIDYECEKGECDDGSCVECDEHFDSIVTDAKSEIDTNIKSWLNDYDRENGTEYSPTGIARERWAKRNGLTQ